MIKAIFFDVDGTLLSHTDGQVPPSTRAAFARLRERGVKLFAATGRHILELRRLAVSCLRFDGYVTLNGQLCLDADGALLHDTPIHREDVARMTTLFAAGRLPITIIEQNRMYINYVTDKVSRAQRAISSPVPPTGGYEGAPVYQFIVYDDGSQANQLMHSLPGCKMSRWSPYAVDIIPKEGGKAAGIRYTLERLGIRPEETAAFGDGENDIDMLRLAGVGVAMGNAGPDVKAQADYVTGHIDQDGLAKALVHFGWLPPPP